MQQPPRVPQLMPSSSYNLGDVLVDKEENQFFFITQNEENRLLGTLMCVEEGIIHSNVYLSDLSVLKQASPTMQQFYVDDSTDSVYKLIREHQGRCLVLSQEKKELIVTDFSDLRASAEEYSFSNPSSPKIDHYSSPNSVTWSDELYDIRSLQKLFRLQEVSEELTQVRLNFIKFTLIPYLTVKRNFLLPDEVRTLFRIAKELFASKPRIVSITTSLEESFTVVGDIHGQFPDLLNIFKLRGYPTASNKYLFNGDIVDRGEQSCACLFVLLAYKIALPENFYINRGNHESNHCEKENFYREMVLYDRYEGLYKAALEMFHYMPTAHILNEMLFIVHGGIAEGLDIAAYNAESRLPPLSIDMTELEMLWNDPGDVQGFVPNPERGNIFKKFGCDAVKKFLRQHKLLGIIRSHSYVHEGFLAQHRGRTLTVFSAPNYCGFCQNEAAVLKIRPRKKKPGLKTRVCYFRHDVEPDYEPDSDFDSEDDNQESEELTESEHE